MKHLIIVKLIIQGSPYAADRRGPGYGSYRRRVAGGGIGAGYRRRPRGPRREGDEGIFISYLLVSCLLGFCLIN